MDIFLIRKTPRIAEQSSSPSSNECDVSDISVSSSDVASKSVKYLSLEEEGLWLRTELGNAVLNTCSMASFGARIKAIQNLCAFCVEVFCQNTQRCRIN
jgi:hypothetical protein